LASLQIVAFSFVQFYYRRRRTKILMRESNLPVVYSEYRVNHSAIEDYCVIIVKTENNKLTYLDKAEQ
jgi:hypothetical protein